MAHRTVHDQRADATHLIRPHRVEGAVCDSSRARLVLARNVVDDLRTTILALARASEYRP